MNTLKHKQTTDGLDIDILVKRGKAIGGKVELCYGRSQGLNLYFYAYVTVLMDSEDPEKVIDQRYYADAQIARASLVTILEEGQTFETLPCALRGRTKEEMIAHLNEEA